MHFWDCHFLFFIGTGLLIIIIIITKLGPWKIFRISWIRQNGHLWDINCNNLIISHSAHFKLSIKTMILIFMNMWICWWFGGCNMTICLHDLRFNQILLFWPAVTCLQVIYRFYLFVCNHINIYWWDGYFSPLKK